MKVNKRELKDFDNGLMEEVYDLVLRRLDGVPIGNACKIISDLIASLSVSLFCLLNKLIQKNVGEGDIKDRGIGAIKTMFMNSLKGAFDYVEQYNKNE